MSRRLVNSALPSVPLPGLTLGESSRKASKGEMNVDQYHDVSAPGWLPGRPLDRHRRRADEEDLPQANALEPIVEEGP